MTLQELWVLFPIVLTQHNPLWAQWAREEIHLLSRLLADYDPVISHIGSTAIPHILAKPIVDILVEIPADIDWHPIRDCMDRAGYICMSRSDNRISYNKGYTPEGYAERVFHIHIHRTGDNAEILFRDYLIEHPETAIQYQQLKASLLLKYRNDRDAYTQAKSQFIHRILTLASL